MTTVNIHEAKTHLSRLLNRVQGGEEIVIAKSGTPIARLVPLAKAEGKREMGFAEGQVKIAGDFDAPLPTELLRRFSGQDGGGKS
jgi:prevent-host-death family protein